MSDLTPGKQRWAALRELAGRGPMGMPIGEFQARYGDLLRGIRTARTATPRPGATSKPTSRPMTRDKLKAAIATASKREPTMDERAIAYHEAGHLVTAHALGGRVISGNLLREGDRVGLARIDHDTLTPQGSVAVALAGAIAERRVSGRGEESRGDKSRMLLALQQVRGGTQLKVYGAAKRQAEQIVQSNWGAIERVASRLLEKLHIDGSEVARLVRG